MAREIGLLAETEENVNPLDSMDGLSNWKVEMSSFLKELNCPHACLYQGDLDSRLTAVNHRLILIDFLLGEVLAARMIKFGNIDTGTTSTGTELGKTLHTLGLGPPPLNVSPAKLFSKLLERISGIEASKRDRLIGKSLFSGGKLNDQQWKILSQVHKLSPCI